MGRPREFEIEDALDAAVKAFWSRGYKATSLEDLMKATGLHKGSLYKAFGGKHAFFKSALEHYLRKVETIHRQSLEGQASPKAGMQQWFARLAEFCVDENGHFLGCMAVNTVTELAPHDPEVIEVVRTYRNKLIALLTETIAKGQAAGEFRAELDPERSGRLLFTVMVGLTVSMKIGGSPEQAFETVNDALEQLS